MSSAGVRPGPAACFALTTAVAVASVLLSAGLEPVSDTVLFPLNAVVLGLAGMLIVSALPRHTLGWLLAGLGLEAAVVELTEGYGYHPALPGALDVQWVSAWGSVLGATATSLVLLLFPTGRVIGPRWRPLLWLDVLAMVLAGLGTAFSHFADDGFTSGTNPHAIGGGAIEVVNAAGQGLWLVSLLGGVASLVVRYRRAQGVERQQLKWLMYVVALLAVVGTAAIFAYHGNPLVQVAIALVVPLVPAAVCVAILRHRLYDIDVLIARTIVYASLTLLLLGAYAATAVVLGAALGRGSSWTTAGATLAAAAAFLPLRRRIQDVVDRRFRRARYDALARTERFLEELRAGRESAEGLQGLLREVLTSPELVLTYVAPDADPASVPSPEGHVRTSVERGGVPLAIVSRPTSYGDGDPGLLDAVLARAGLAIEIARLQAEVTHRLAQVQESRARIVAAGHQERRRLERDLHDGAQQRLVSVGLALRHAQHRLGASPVADVLDLAVVEISAAIADLRELAHGVRPALLGDGLEAALRELARRTPVPVQVRADGARFPADVEATAYFVACEALANTVKHAHATTVELRAGREADWLTLTVSDDGVGGALPDAGSGLRGLLDRVAAQGGRIDLDSPPGAGTTLSLRLPCAS